MKNNFDLALLPVREKRTLLGRIFMKVLFCKTRVEVVLSAVACLVALRLSATTFTVVNANDSGPGSLRQAIQDIPVGGTINFDTSVFGSGPGKLQLITINSPLIVSKSLTIVAPSISVFNGGPLTVKSSATGTPSVDMNIFSVDVPVGTTVLISYLGIAQGYRPVGGGGGIYNSGANLTLNYCTISGNRASTGGGILNVFDGVMTLNNCTVSDNIALGGGGNGGGGIDNLGQMTLNNCTVAGNLASYTSYGGGIYNGIGTSSGPETLIINNSTIAYNKCDGTGGTYSGDGGGIYNEAGGTVKVGSSLVAHNSVTPDHNGQDIFGHITSQGYNLIRNPLGIFLQDQPPSTFPVTGDKYYIEPWTLPLGDWGGPTKTVPLLAGSPALDAGKSQGFTTDQRGEPRIRDLADVPNAPGGDGCDIGAFEGSIYNTITTLNDGVPGSMRSAISNANTGDTIAFAPSLSGTLTLTKGELVVDKNIAICGPMGGKIVISGNNSNRVFHVTAENAVISDLTISNGRTNGPGAGIFCESGSTLALQNCTVSGNVSGDSGGGVANNGTVLADNCTFSGNQSQNGGGIYTYGGPIVLRNCTVVSNTAASPTGAGGGVFAYSPDARTSAEMIGTLVARNGAGSHDDIVGVVTSAGNNLIGKIDYITPTAGGAAGVPTAGVTNSQNHDIVGSTNSPVNPLVGPLRDNGGPAYSHALLPGSPAIDAGPSTDLGVDQRGAPRPIPGLTNAVGSASDIGAYELGNPQLQIAANGPTNLVLSWPSFYGDFDLQHSTNLVTSGSWSNATLTVQDDGTTKTAAFNPATGKQFYKLINRP